MSNQHLAPIAVDFETEMMFCGELVTYWNAYVYIPKEHPLYGFDYQNLPNDFFSDKSHLSYSSLNTPSARWVFGFSGDPLFGLNTWMTEEETKEELDKLKQTLIDIYLKKLDGVYPPPEPSSYTLKNREVLKERGLYD